MRWQKKSINMYGILLQKKRFTLKEQSHEKDYQAWG
jgi:hypothetical protein